MFNSPYQTSNGSLHNLKKLEKEVELAHATGTLTPATSPAVPGLYYIDVKPETKTIPAIPLPLTVENRNEWYVVFDLRQYSSYLNRLRDSSGNLVLPDSGPIGLLFKQAMLQMIWQKGQSEKMITASDLPLSVYSSWISETLQQKLGLNQASHDYIKAVVGWFYLCQFMSKEQAEEASALISGKLMKLHRAIRVDIGVVQGAVQNIGYIADVAELIEKIKLSGDPKASQLNVGMFYTLLSHGWFGHANDQFTVAAALEFPPLFMSYVYAAATESSYKETPIAKVTQRMRANNALLDYKRTIDVMLKPLMSGAY